MNVPFAFVAGGQTLPAGRYIVAADNMNVKISNFQTSSVFVSVHSTSRTTSDGSKLVFHRYGGTYFLSAVWVAGNTTGRELFRSRAERDLAARQAEMELATVRPEELRPEKEQSAK